MALLVSAAVICILVLHCSGQCQCLPDFISTDSPSNDHRNESCSCSEWLAPLKEFVEYNNGCDHIMISFGHCLTYDEKTDSLYAGSCPYNNHNRLTIPWNFSKLERVMCAPYNRKGKLCGECRDGFGPVMSRSMHCKKCNIGLGLIKYLTVQIIPSTILFFLIMLFDIQLPKSPLNACILFFQISFNAINYDSNLYSHGMGINHFFKMCFNFILAFYGIFNLDFFGLFGNFSRNNICLSLSMKGMHTLMLEYIAAAYPCVLIILVYACISLFNHNCKPIVLAWEMSRRVISYSCFERYFKRANSSKCIANAFAAFLILVYSKFLFISLNILIPSKLYKIEEGKVVEYLTLYYDPTVSYFGKDHIPYAITAIVILFIFIVMPLLTLALYPFKPFVLFLKLILRSKWHYFNYFIEIFQGWFKNGTDATSSDYRIMSAIFPMLKILFSVWAMIFTGLLRRGSHVWLIPSIVIQVTGFFFVLFRPYKIEMMNKCDAVIIWLLGIIAFVLISAGRDYYIFALIMMYLPGVFIVIYFVFRIGKWIENTTGFMLIIRRKFHSCCQQPDNGNDCSSLLPQAHENEIPSMNREDNDMISYGAI